MGPFQEVGRASAQSAMATKYLRPMLDPGSPRVFNFNQMTRGILAKDPAARLFFRNKPLNNLVLIKDTVPVDQRRGAGASIGTKLYFPFDQNDIYEGGRTIFVHDSNLRRAIAESFGQGALEKDALDEDLRLLGILNKLPSLDPFLMKDAFLREGTAINDAYFEISPEAWREIEVFLLLRFESLVKAAFPDAMSSDDKARVLIEKVWEGRDLVALRPLIEAFRLPPEKALEIFSAWKGILFYLFQYERAQPDLIKLVKWLAEIKVPFGALPAAERTALLGSLESVKTELRHEWQVVDKILREYQDAYDKMFKLKVSSSEFLAFLRDCTKAYWDLGNSLGKVGHAVYCWNVTSARFAGRKLPMVAVQEIIRLLAEIFQPEKKAVASGSW